MSSVSRVPTLPSKASSVPTDPTVASDVSNPSDSSLDLSEYEVCISDEVFDLDDNRMSEEFAVTIDTVDNSVNNKELSKNASLEGSVAFLETPSKRQITLPNEEKLFPWVTKKLPKSRSICLKLNEIIKNSNNVIHDIKNITKDIIKHERERSLEKSRLTIQKITKGLNILSGEPSLIEIEEAFGLIKEVHGEIQSTLQKGFINSVDIMDTRHYPVISGLIPLYLNNIEEEEGKNTRPATIDDIKMSLRSDVYQWTFSLVMMDIYLVLCKGIRLMSKDPGSYGDIYYDYKVLSRETFNKIDPSIRVKLMKKGVGIIGNTYVGYDTEYTNIDIAQNQLLSMQLAVSSRVILKLPRITPYKWSGIDTLRGIVYELVRCDKVVNYTKLLDDINTRINKICDVKYGDLDASLSLITGCITSDMDNNPNTIIQKDDMTYILFKRTYVRTTVEICNKLSMSHVVETILKLSNDDLRKELENTKSYLEHIYRSSESDLMNKSKELVVYDSTLKKVVDKSSLLISSADAIEVESKEIENQAMPSVKGYSRTNSKSFSSDTLSVSTVRNIYLVSHLTNTDLSFMSDFDKFKDELNIVNKSFVTLNKPLKIEITSTNNAIINKKKNKDNKGDYVNVYIRDSMLLAPQGKKSLDNW